jgi:hypothetical protein
VQASSLIFKNVRGRLQTVATGVEASNSDKHARLQRDPIDKGRKKFYSKSA